MGKAKVTVTIEKELLHDLDLAARLTRQSRSSVLENAVRMWRKALLDRELADGYRAMSGEDLQVAEENLPAAYEALK